MLSGKYYCMPCIWQCLVPVSCSVIPLLLHSFGLNSTSLCLPTLQTMLGVTATPQDAL